MTPTRWDRLEVLLERAREIPTAERQAFVTRETSDDPSLRTELLALLEATQGAAEYFSQLRDELLGSAMTGILREAPAAAEGPDPWIGRTVSHYQIRERIGGGGMGVVYRATDARLGREVALKFIAPEIRREPLAQQRFLQEARAASTLDHPNICTIHEIAETDDGRPFIVMAAYEGETLRARIERGPLSVAEAVDIATQIAQALAAAHERGIVHRDVKPDNVFVTRDRVVKLLDFGLARVADARMSGTGTVAGTVSYMSPEQARGQPTDERSDVWAVGVIMFEMLAGARPFPGSSPAEVIDLIQSRDPEFSALPPEVPPEISATVRRALSKDLGTRFANGRELLGALRSAKTGPARWWSRARIGAVVLVVVAGGAAVAISLFERKVPPGSVAHILWVDDNPENNTAVIQQLRDRGVEVTSALSTDEAVERYDPAVHQLVVSDMGRYEGVDKSYLERAGFTLLARLRARRSDVRLVFCTSARAVTSYRAEAISAGALDVVEDCARVLQVMGF